MPTLILLVTAGGCVALTATRRARHDRLPQRTHTVRDYLRAGLYAWFPFGPSPGSVAAQLLRWAQAEHMPVTAERSLAPAGIVFGLTQQEYDTVASRRRALQFATEEAIRGAAEEHGRHLLVSTPWVRVQVDSRARPGLPTLEGCYDAGAVPPVEDRSAERGEPVPRPAGARRMHTAGPVTVSSGPANRNTVANPAVGRTTVATSHWLEIDDEPCLLSSTTVIGRGHGCDVEVLHPQVSRRHAVLQVVGAVAYLEDLGSVNGTFVDDVPLTGSIELVNGAVIRLGTHGPALVYHQA